MAQKPEAKFKAKIHKHLPDYVYHQGMYTPFSAGTPDHWFSGVESDLWVEYKWQGHLPQKIMLCNSDVKHPLLTAKQQQWLNGRYNEGRNVAVIYGNPQGAVIFEQRAWEIPMTREVFLAQSMDALAIAQWIVSKVSNKKHVKNKELLPL